MKTALFNLKGLSLLLCLFALFDEHNHDT